MNRSAEIRVTCSSLQHEKKSRGARTYLDISFDRADEAVDFDYLSFKNYYVYSISMAQSTGAQTHPTYATVLENKILMENPHCENGSQKLFTVSVSEFNSNYTPGRHLRVFLVQPSPMWSKFELLQIRAFARNHNKKKAPSSSSSAVCELPTSDYPSRSITSCLLTDLKCILKAVESSKAAAIPTLSDQGSGGVDSYQYPTRQRKEKKRSHVVTNTRQQAVADRDELSDDSRSV
jgi:hypothetical protein